MISDEDLKLVVLRVLVHLGYDKDGQPTNNGIIGHLNKTTNKAHDRIDKFEIKVDDMEHDVKKELRGKQDKVDIRERIDTSAKMINAIKTLFTAIIAIYLYIKVTYE